MQYHWLNKQNNDKLIIFFAGWSFDYKPFEFLNCEDYDVLMVFDYNLCHCEESVNSTSQSHYNEITTQTLFARNDILNYKQYYLIAWSMGVFTAYQLRNELPKFDEKIAINGTPFPVDDEFGIPQKPFLLTLRHAKTGLEGKFYQNIFNSEDEFKRYMKNPVGRSIESRVEELKSLYDRIKITEKIYEPFYDRAIVSSNDKIIPTKNQLNFWQSKAEIIESGHFPFYKFSSWNEILCR